MNKDRMTAAERPRRRLVSVLAVLLPVVVLVGAAAWFVRAYVMPPMIPIGEPATAAADLAAAKNELRAAATRSLETTGATQEPAVRYTNDTAAIWASVPLPGLPRTVQTPAQSVAAVQPQLSPIVDIIASEPITGPIPLPPRRPRVSATTVDGDVPLPPPRPRPTPN
jgi:hypothetical protein